MIDPMPGDIFRRGEVLNNTYEIEGVLGRGGTGEVYRARNQITGRVVAIKVLNRAFSANADYLELLKREEAMRAINHDAVVGYTDCSRTDSDLVYIVMDYVDGAPLSDWLEAGGADPRSLLVVAHRAAQGLVATHAAQIVHRDLSPDNIILRDGEPDRATIIDFGIAKDTSAGARTIVGHNFAGKYEYAAPEQMHGQAEPRSDLYALGASLLATFRGRVPDVGASPGEVVRHKEAPLDVAGVPEPLGTLIVDLTQPDPARRPPSAAAVVVAIDAMLRPVGPPRRRRRWPVLAPLAFAAIAALVAVVWLIGPFGPPAKSPYRLAAAWDGASGVLEGYAPDTSQREAITTAFAAAIGGAAPADGLDLASGAPTQEWADAIAALLAAADGLQEWRLDVQDSHASLEGVAPDAAARDAAVEAFRSAAGTGGFEAAVRLAAGPRDLTRNDVAALVAPFASCGPLTPVPADADVFPLGSTVGVAGSVAEPGEPAAIRDLVLPRIGDRSLRLDLEVLNPTLCAVRALLPDAPPEGLSIVLGYGDRAERNMTGVYAVGDNPILQVYVPAETDGFLWVALADVGGNVYNLLPNTGRPEHRLDAIGVVADGMRTVSVTFPSAERARDRIAIEIDDTFGKSLVLVFLTDAPLFPEMLPLEESVEAFTADLAVALESGDVRIKSITTRLMDSRK